MKIRYLLLLVLTGSIESNAQQSMVNSGALRVHTGAQMNIVGSFTNSNTASLVNNGSLRVKRNVTNDQASMSAGSGTFYLDGNVQQTLGGTQPFAVHHLVTSNSSGFTLNQDLTIAGTHNFIAGIISTAVTPRYLVYESGSGYSGSGDQAHVNGWVRKKGNSGFRFPVGNGTIERAVTISGLTATSDFEARYLATTPYSSQLESPLVSIDHSEYWTINRVSGGNASVTLEWDNSKVSIPQWLINDVTVARYNGSKWEEAVSGTPTGNITTTGSVTSGLLSAFGRFTFASKTFPIPLSLLSFDARRRNGSTFIDWRTVNEHDVSHFQVERSDDANNFYQTDRQPARNSGSIESYNSRDDRPLSGIAYYRLRMVDMNGSEKFSRIVPVSEKQNGELVLMSNPVISELSLKSTRVTGSFDYSLVSMNGQQLQTGKTTFTDGSYTRIGLNGNVMKGSYLLIISNEKEKYHFRIAVQ